MSAPCFKDTAIKTTLNEKGEVIVNLKLGSSSSFTCTEFYLFAYHGDYNFEEFYIHGEKTVNLGKPKNEAHKYDLE
jgi:hypothetical protein